MARDSQPSVDTSTLREVLLVLGERHSLGVMIADFQGAVVFATPRARRLLGAVNGHSATLSAEIHRFAESIAHGPRDDATSRMTFATTPHVVQVRVSRLPGAPPKYLLITAAEEGPRGALSKTLVEKYNLSARSVQLVQLASRGLKNKEIGVRMQLSEATIKTYMHGLFRELGVRNRAELVALAERLVKGQLG